MMPRVISVGTNKGGAGKSAVAMFTALVAASKGKKCAVIDIDSQCGLSFRLPGASKFLRRNLVKSIISGGDVPVEDFEIGENIWFVPGDLVSDEFGKQHFGDDRTDQFLDGLLSRYDIVIADSGPRPTEFEKKVLARGDVHLLPAGADKASIVGVVYRMTNVLDIVKTAQRDRFFFIPWGVNTGEKTGKNAQLMEHITGVMKDFGMSVIEPFPPVQDMTDLICGLDSMTLETFLKYPGIARKKKEISEWADCLWQKIQSLD